MHGRSKGFVVVVGFLALTGCGSSLPAELATSFGNVLAATKQAVKTTCNPHSVSIAGATVECRSPELDLQCDIAAAYLDSAIMLYTKMNDELKE